MVALLNTDIIAERFGDIDSAKLTLPLKAAPVEYVIDGTDEQTLISLLTPTQSDVDDPVLVEDATGRQILLDTSMEQLSSGLFAALSSFKGLYRTVALVSVSAKGQIGGVYVVYKFKAV